MTKSRILVVEDEDDIRRFVRMTLEKEGMDVYEASTVEQARIDLVSHKPDLYIVDLGMPDDDGKVFIQELRMWSTAASVIVLSAREQEAEKVAALDAGADDYLVKPFGVPELLARVRAQLRRVSLVTTDGPPASVVRLGKTLIDIANREVTRDGKPVHLTRLEFRLLSALIRSHGKVMTHRQLLLEVWGTEYIERMHYVRVYMMNLRQKLEDDPTQPKHLITELQIGYRLAGMEVQQPS